ncbi:CKLF-like MARVEL transmembrane domain-containing protein 6 [Clupea harengus]|uniref:CKLF-like MARVEL transmembrane domain-containing protein 6 n=1 Tax=Clupea harengus TaxID=7950 RepID=A0A6P8GAY6_CLUHA|nr:CKLF-like MARVEL transmembrane domain-containing protein 6 [Clupea harengus]XP_031432280.1 CKLF-like MARVEL transmembrane domain-containing protein 6 [Clupea harengus]
MADHASPYVPTTTAVPKSSTFGYLKLPGFVFKLIELVLSFVAFVLEEVVTTCNACSHLYFFEFVSCTAFLFTLLLLILLATPLYEKVGFSQWDPLDFVYTVGIALLFIIASAVFLSDNGGSELEKAAGVFGIIASLVFFANAAYLYKVKGKGVIPCTTSRTETIQHPQDQQPPGAVGPESEKLTNGQGV